MKKKFQLFIILLISLIFSYCVAYLANMFFSNNFVFEFVIDFNIAINTKTLIYTAFIFMIFVLIILMNYHKKLNKDPKLILQAKEEDSDIITGLEQAHFQSQGELDKNFVTIDYLSLPQKDIEGIPIFAEETKKKYEITFAKPAHTLVIGTTGSGKTTTYVNPIVQILANTKTKPSMLIADPKGELYSLHAKSLIKQGYDVEVLDLRNPYCSIRWNPLQKPFEQYQEMLNLEDKVIINEEAGFYIFDEKVFYDEEEKAAAVQVRKQQLFDEVYEDLNDICSVLCPIANKGEPIWESGAKNFILAITLAMLEDSENHKLEMTKDKFNFFNIMKIATNTQNDCLDLINYFKKRSPLSKAVSLSKQVLDASDKTRGSYLSTVFDKLSIFADMSICSLTSENEIDFSNIATKPTALFLQIPDEKETRHTLAAMVILQAYKALVEKANTYEDLSLPRSVYFILDEFGNLPKIHKLEQMITVGRSRKIWLSLVVQSYAQLAKVYDDKSADIIKSNCNIQIFIGTTDQKTIEEFSKRCGNFSLLQRGVSVPGGKNDLSSSISIKERPLIYPTELQQLNNPGDMGNAIVTVFGFPPIKSKFTPSYKSRYFVMEKTNQLLSEGKYFNEQKTFYDMIERNKIVYNKMPMKETITANPFLTSFEIDLNNFDFEEIGCTEIKIKILELMKNNKFNDISNQLLLIEEFIDKNDNECVTKLSRLKYLTSTLNKKFNKKGG